MLVICLRFLNKYKLITTYIALVLYILGSTLCIPLYISLAVFLFFYDTKYGVEIKDIMMHNNRCLESEDYNKKNVKRLYENMLKYKLGRYKSFTALGTTKVSLKNSSPIYLRE